MTTNLGMPSSHECNCGHHDAADLPVLVASEIPHEIRHAAIFGALEGAPRGIVLVAPHDPLPLLAQLEARWPGQFDVEYVERETAWRIAITRRLQVLASS